MKNLNKTIASVLITSIFMANAYAQTKKATVNNITKTSAAPSVTKTATPSKPAEVKTVSAEPKKEINDKPAVKTKKSYTASQSSFVKGSKYLGGGASFSGGSVFVTLSAEYGLTADISFAGLVWLSSVSVSGGISSNYCLSRLLQIQKLDPYIGATVAYQSGQVTSTDANGNRVDKNGITRVVGQAGVQYRMSANMVAFAQYSVGIINGGAGWPSAGIKFSL